MCYDFKNNEENMNRIFRPIEKPNIMDDGYISDDKWTMRRESGLTPNGNPINDKWVLRDNHGKWVDFDRYRNDLAERNEFEIDE